jgi:hypothetical protein
MRISRFLVGIEMLALTLPVTYLLAMGGPLVVRNSKGGCEPYVLLIRIAAAGSAAGLIFGCYLAFTFVRRGSVALASLPLLYWIGAGLGLVVALVAVASEYLPVSETNECIAAFRVGLGPFSLGLVLGIPLVHLWLERARGERSNFRLERPRG